MTKQTKPVIESTNSVTRTLCSVSLLIFFGTNLGGCATNNIGAGVSNVTLQTIKIVCLSHKDTAGTITQVAENNGALQALGAPKPKCKVR